MKLRRHPMRPQDVKACVELNATHPEQRRRYGDLLQHLTSAWLKLLRAELAIAQVLEDTDGRTPRAVACGLSVFVTDELLRRLKTAPFAWIGPQLLRRSLDGDSQILTPQRVREANSRDGLNLVVWDGIAQASNPDDQVSLNMALLQAFVQSHQGYRIKELICQPLDLEQILTTPNFGLFWLSSEGTYVDCASVALAELTGDPFVLGCDRQAGKLSLGSWLSALFSYTNPRIYLRPAEQRLLLVALNGITDDELADELGVSIFAVKKTWRTVYERAASALPDEFPSTPSDDVETRRGKQKKQRLLSYLREHLEELRPVMPHRRSSRK